MRRSSHEKDKWVTNGSGGSVEYASQQSLPLLLEPYRRRKGNPLVLCYFFAFFFDFFFFAFGIEITCRPNATIRILTLPTATKSCTLSQILSVSSYLSDLSQLQHSSDSATFSP